MKSYGNRALFSPFLLVATLAVGLLIPAPGAAQIEVPHDSDFNLQLFSPAPGPNNFFNVEGTDMGRDMKATAHFWALYQHRPLVLLACNGDDCSEGGTGTDIDAIDSVQNLLAIDLGGNFTFLKRYSAGLALPLTLWQRGFDVENPEQGFTFVGTENRYEIRPGEEYVHAGKIGDLRIHLKARILGRDRTDGYSLAVSVIPRLPIGYWTTNNRKHFGSERSFYITVPKIIAGYRHKQFRVAANLGLLIRPKSEYYSSQIGTSITWGVAAGYRLIDPLELIAEFNGAKVLVADSFSDLESWPTLFLGGARFTHKDFQFNLAGGGGIISGVGVPQFQVIAGVSWVPKPDKDAADMFFSEWDVDGDGIDNEADSCPDTPEDLDGYQDNDGCPEADNDGDGIADGYDSCPMQAEDKDNFRDDDGCPDLDHDMDGVNSPADECPEQAEDQDGFQDEDGCPDADNDHDGFLDAKDHCPNHAEDKDKYQDDDGCPEFDNDWDGVADKDDKCPNESENLNGSKDTDGCPDRGTTLVKVSQEKIALLEMVKFKSNTDAIRGKGSFEVLDIVAFVLKGNTAVRVTIEGHTDNKGNDTLNRELSGRRAEAVKAYLVKQGISADRLDTVGHGPSQPIASNKTSKGRKANRRVEFILIHPRREIAQEEEEMTFDEEDEGDEMTFDEDEGDEMTFDEDEGDEMTFDEE